MEITATLTRFHKIEERCKIKRSELESKTRKLVQGKEVTLTKGMKNVPVDNKSDSEEAISLLKEIEELSLVIYTIRAALGQKNTELGIGKMLAELEQQRYLKRVANNIRLYGSRSGAEIDSDDLVEVLAGLSTSEDAVQVTIPVKGLHSGYEQDVNTIIDEYDTIINRLTDEISDLNKEKITLGIPDKFKGLVGK